MSFTVLMERSTLYGWKRSSHRFRLTHIGFQITAILLFGLSFALSAPARSVNIVLGRKASILKTGMDRPARGLSWDIIHIDAIYASSRCSNGWSVSYDTASHRFTVGVPYSATPNLPYEVRYRGNGRTVSTGFNVLATGSGILALTLDAKGIIAGNTCAGSIVLASPAPPAGAIVTLSSSKKNSVTVPSHIEIPAGTTTATFRVTTFNPSATPVLIRANFNGATNTAALRVVSQGLRLTSVARSRGFQLSLFACNFPTLNQVGPVGSLVAGANVLVSDAAGYVRVFATDTDNQDASAIPIASSSGASNAVGLTSLNNQIYLAQSNSGKLVQLNPNGKSHSSGFNLSGPAGIVADPFARTLYISSPEGGAIWKVNPEGNSATLWLSGIDTPDGLTISPDGRTLYVASLRGQNVLGFDTQSGSIVFDYRKSNPALPLNGPCGIGIGRGALTGNLYVNTTTGNVYEIPLATGAATIIATGGSRGNFVSADPDGTLLVTQSDRILRLIPPSGGSFNGVSSGIVATRDDLTDFTLTPYAPIKLMPPNLTGYSNQNAQFDLKGLSGGITSASIQRDGQIEWSNESSFVFSPGISSVENSAFATFGAPRSSIQYQGSSPLPYFSSWEIQPLFRNYRLALEMQNHLGEVYKVKLIDKLNNTSNTYAITDRLAQGWPAFQHRNRLTLTIYPIGNPAIDAGRALDITLPWIDTPYDGIWEILYRGTVIASSESPDGWDVEQGENLGAIVTVPKSATPGVGYEVRYSSHFGAGFFDVVKSVKSAPVLLPISAQNTTVIGGNTTMATLTLDAPAPKGGASITLSAFNGGVRIPSAVTIPAGQTSAHFTIATYATTFAITPNIGASYNGQRTLSLMVVPGKAANLIDALDLKATSGYGRVALTWTVPSLQSYTYTISRSQTRMGPYTRIATGVVQKQYLDRHVANGATYYYEIAGEDAFRKTARSNIARARTSPPAPIAGLTLNPLHTTGSEYSIGAVTLSSPAPAGGAPVTISSSNPRVATVPANIRIPEGSSSGLFAISTRPVGASASVTIKANSSKARLAVHPPAVSQTRGMGLTFNQNPVIGGNKATGTVTLSAPASASGATVELSTGNTNIARIPAVVHIAAGTTRARFALTTRAVANSTSVSISVKGRTGCTGSANWDLVVNPSNFNTHISNLTMGPTYVLSGGTTTGTVILNGPAPPGGATVQLRSYSKAASVPPFVRIPTGKKTSQFSITGNRVTEEDDVAIAGSYNTWTQSATLAVLPAGSNLTIQTVTAGAGNGCASLVWQNLPRRTILGYNVYRVISNPPTYVLLNASPISDSIYFDTNLQNGQVYSYQARVVDLQGNESSASNVVSVTPTASGATMNWNNPPQSITGTAILNAALSSGEVLVSELLIDGKISGTGGYGDDPTTPAGIIRFGLDTTSLSNGPHIFQVYSFGNGVSYASLPITIQVNNTLSAFAFGHSLNVALGYIVQMDTVVPATTTSWTLQILDSNNHVVRSWQSNSTSIHLTWDGSDATGNLVPKDGYDALLTVIDSSHATIKKSVSFLIRHVS